MNRSLGGLLRIAAPFAFIVAVLGSPEAALAGQAPPALPQMGFNNWNSTHCRDEFNEAMIRGVADKFITLGLRDAGYRYVNIDDCWANWQRDKNGRLQPNPKRFPSGIKALADYIHQKGLKFGLYSSAGTSTCEPLEENRGFPGGLGHEKQDAATFASWHVDYLKYDNCNNQKVDARQRYAAMAEALRGTGRPIFFSVCEWGENKPWLWAGKPPVSAGSWRTTGDISDNYASMLKNFKQNVVLDRYATPGHWNDPDMLEVGNGGMTDVEYRSHFSLWAIMAAPLLIGTDLRTIKPDALKILLNKEVIAVDQDPLGVQGKQVSDADGIHVIVKPLKDGSEAVAVFNETDSARDVSVGAGEIGLKKGASYRSRDLWAHTDTTGDGSIKVNLPAHATVIYRISRL
ncbi:MAG TPA: glycoside hydrolase family 27 protein [Dyella sp.]|uniref:glycoside hydrolase family 27 protein n=1 Tax=Dyella sp. TaxID=1869338 RepID=UPI002CE9ED67|nr:glycoside hydrolase family 27 protein [Dyella sp.]HTV84854.1 glycoside hydrolase family 27 protein [Dyella sp.]